MCALCVLSLFSYDGINLYVFCNLYYFRLYDQTEIIDKQDEKLAQYMCNDGIFVSRLEAFTGDQLEQSQTKQEKQARFV